MALVLKLRPKERVVVNGALIRNAGEHGITLNVMNRATLIHERDILLPEDAKSPLAQLYLRIQDLLLDANNTEAHRKAFVHAAAKLYAQAMTKKDDATRDLIGDMIRLVSEDNFYRAMRLLKPAIGVDKKKSPTRTSK